MSVDSGNIIPLKPLDDTEVDNPSDSVVEVFHPAGVAELDLYQTREKIYTRRIEGFYQRIRVYTGWPLLLGYFLVPWLQWDDHQAVLFDLPQRQFYILGLTFWPQDFSLLAWLLAIAAFGLFTVTVVAGRVWCGYTCPQTVWTAIFMWAEQLCEGSRNQRIKRDNGPLNWDKGWRKTAKHLMWIVFAVLTGFTFVGYFSPIRDMAVNLLQFAGNASGQGRWMLSYWEWAWIIFFSSATYINAGWMREQVCMYMCPYARFQAVMFDKDTLIVSYDYHRGEQRGSRKKNVDYRALGLGDCVDCNICVQVCPVGIDIRNGLQYECINCALCIDGCNSVMEQMGYSKGLIRYTTENALEGKPSTIFRPRLMGYTLAFLVMVSVFVGALVSRVPLKLDVIRERDRLYSRTSDGLIENVYLLKVINMTQRPHSYQLVVTGLEGIQLLGEQKFLINDGEVLELPVRLSIDPVYLPAMNNVIEFIVTQTDNDEITRSTESRFLGPRL